MDEIRAAASYLHEHRPDPSAPFEMVYLGRPTPGADPEQAAAIVRDYAELGVTYWLENTLPFVFGGDLGEHWHLEQIRERILQGPPRID